MIINKHCTKSFFALMLGFLFSLVAFAGPRYVLDSELIFKNFLKNPNAENGTAQWTASGGTFTIATGSPGRIEGTKTFAWNSSAAGQTFDSATVTVSSTGLAGKNVAFSALLKCAVSPCTHTMNAYDGSVTLASAAVTTSDADDTSNTLNFIMPTSGSVRLRFESVAADEPELYVDSVRLADSTGLGGGSQPTFSFIGSAYIDNNAACTSWTRTNTALGAFGADTECTGPVVESNPGPGVIQTTDANLPRFTVQNLPVGTYRVRFVGATTTQSAGAQSCLAINDGTSTKGRQCQNIGTSVNGSADVEAFFTYTSPGDRTFELYGSSSTGSLSILLDGSNKQLYFYIERYPLNQEFAVLPSQYPVWGEVRYAGATNCAWSHSAASWAGAFSSDGDCPTATFYGYASQVAGDPGTSTLKVPAMKIFVPTGRFLITAQGGVQTTASAAFTTCGWKITDGTNDSPTQYSASSLTTNNGTTYHQTWIYDNTSAGFKTFRVSMYRAGGDGACTLYAASTVTGFSISLIDISRNVPAPLVIGGVGTLSNGNVNIYSAVVSSADAVSNEVGGDWISGNCTNATTGRATCTFASGAFTSAPNCTCSVIGTAGRSCNINAAPTISSVIVDVYATSTGTAIDQDFELKCMGPR